jgi:hypothetical protein
LTKWTLDDFIRSLREKLDEVGSTDYFTDSELTKYINQAVFDLTGVLKLQDSKTLTIDNISTIDFKEIFVTDSEKTKAIQDRQHNFFNIEQVFVNGIEVPVGTLNDKSTGADVSYIWGEKLRFTIPKTGLLEAYYYRLPKAMLNSNDTSDVPEKYQHIPLIYAMAQCRRKDEDENQYSTVMNSYMLEKNQMQDELNERDNDGVYYVQIKRYGDCQ